MRMMNILLDRNLIDSNELHFKSTWVIENSCTCWLAGSAAIVEGFPPQTIGLCQLCANPNPDSELFGLDSDSDSDSELESKLF